MKTRTEGDSLGSVSVPAVVLYGPRTARGVANYPISGFRAHPVFIRSYALLKLACAEVNTNLGRIPHPIGQAVIQASKESVQGLHHDQLMVDVYQASAGVSFHMNINEVIASLAIFHLANHRGLRPPLGDYSRDPPNGHVNYAQSGNYMFLTTTRRAVLMLLEEF